MAPPASRSAPTASRHSWDFRRAVTPFCWRASPPTARSAGTTPAPFRSSPSGYTVIVDGSSSQSVGANGVATFLGLPSGSHTVLLAGFPPHLQCFWAEPLTPFLFP